MSLIKTITEYFAGMPRRSSRWPALRAAHLKDNPRCICCGSKTNLEVHHILPFHLYPDQELAGGNLVTLCEAGGNCHFLIGHLKDWKSYNLDVRKDAEVLRKKIQSRP